MPTAPEPGWVWEVCGRGHSLRLHGLPRKDRPNGWACRACQREWDRERTERSRELPGYGWRGREHMCSHLYEPCEPDETAVLRMMSGEPPEQFHQAERTEAIRRLNAAGLSAAQIARRVGSTSRTVQRVRARMRMENQDGTA